MSKIELVKEELNELKLQLEKAEKELADIKFKLFEKEIELDILLDYAIMNDEKE